MGYFKLEPASLADDAESQSTRVAGLTSAVLLHNARWFIQIRWIVVASLAFLGAAGLLLDPELLMRLGFLPPGLFPLVMASMLAILNLVSIQWVRHIPQHTTVQGVAANIWFQITSDLLFLTVLVYRMGSIDTVVSFTYLFHITMACIFFGRRDSFIVTMMSAFLFMATVAAECAGAIPYATILATSPGKPEVLSAIIFSAPTVFVWLIVWHLVSSLSEAVRRRDRDLDSANRRLTKADEAINLQMLRVTHDLKAPFSGIEGNIQILKHAHWSELPEAVQQIIGKIDARSASLRTRIGDILMLGSLRSTKDEKLLNHPVILRDLLDSVIQDVHDLAVHRNVSVVLSPGDGSLSSEPDKLKILFSNLVANAITYSREGGTVEVKIDKATSGVRVSITDHGIGISEQSLPHIFEDFYRTQEASAFNQASTGLGLAIVRQIADKLKLTIEVESEKDKGSVFQILFPTALLIETRRIGNGKTDAHR